MHNLLEGFVKTVNAGKLWSTRERKVNTGSLGSCLQKITVYFLFLCCLLVSNQQLFGQPIQCLSHEKGEESEKTLNSYCFVSATYSVVGTANTAVYPGIEPDSGAENSRRHAYYQWVPLVLLLQAAMFMIPQWLWNGCEAGLVEGLLTNLDDDLERRMPQLKESKFVEKAADYFKARLGCLNRILGTAWIFCDILALLNVVGNFYLIDALFNGMFWKFGLHSLLMITDDRFSAPLIFPLLTQCSLNTYGYSGSVQRMDSICVMTLNAFNQVIFLILWFWLQLLAILTLVLIIAKLLRIANLKYWSANYVESTLGVPTKIPGNDLQKCTAVMSFGDCVLFHILAKNMHPMTYARFVKRLSFKITSEKAEKVL